MNRAMELSSFSPRNWFQRGEPTRSGFAGDLLPVSRLHRDIDRWFDEFMTDFGMPRLGTLATAPTATTALLHPQLDVVESKDAYTVTVEVPGVDRKDITVELRDGALLIAGEKNQATQTGDDRAYRVERSYGRFERVLDLPEDARLEKIDAHYANGVLTVTVPRDASKSAGSGRRIEVRASS